MLSLSRPLAIIDLEATGTDPESARIIQVADPGYHDWMRREIPHLQPHIDEALAR